MADITIVNGVYKPTNITGGHHPASAPISCWILLVPGERPGPATSPETRRVAARAGRQGPGTAAGCAAPRTAR